MSKPGQCVQSDTPLKMTTGRIRFIIAATYRPAGDGSHIALSPGATRRRIYVGCLFFDYSGGFAVHHELIAGTALAQKLIRRYNTSRGTEKASREWTRTRLNTREFVFVIEFLCGFEQSLCDLLCSSDCSENPWRDRTYGWQPIDLCNHRDPSPALRDRDKEKASHPNPR